MHLPYSKKVKMSEAINDMTAYSRLTDGVLHLIMASSDPNLEKVYGSLNFSCILQLLILTLFHIVQEATAKNRKKRVVQVYRTDPASIKRKETR